MKNLLFAGLLLIAGFGFSQNLYDIRWNIAGVDYYGFMVFFSEDDAYMRVGYYGEDGSYNLVNSTYQYSVDEEDGSVITMVATSSEYVQNTTSDEWDPEHLFWYKDETTGEFVGPFIITNSDLEAENYDRIIEPEFVEVDMAWLNEEYLRFFYYTDEPDYKILLEAGNAYPDDNSESSDTYEQPADDQVEAVTIEESTDYSTTNPGSGSVKIHLVAVANTAISDIGASTAVDLNNMVAEISGISEFLGIPMNKMLITDKQFTKKNVENFLSGFSPGANDIVFFLYSGHGYRFSNQSEKYPQLDMRYSEYMQMDDDATMNLRQVFDEIVKKGARLNIVLGDCCNSDIGFSRSIGSSFMNSRSSVDPDPEKLKELFLRSEGDIIAAGASKGQYSWCTQNGGFFTCSFIAAVREEISKFKTDDVPDWGDIMTQTVSATRKKSDICSECDPQDVIYDRYD